MKHGYQDCSAWTLMESTPVERRKAAWLYAQFCTCKSVSLKKTFAGLTPFRSTDIRSEAMDRAAPDLGGLVEFYRSPVRQFYTPTGSNVPHYPLLAQAWWRTLAAAVHGEVDPQEVMTRIASDQDALLARLSQDPAIITCPPQLNEPENPAVWLERPGAPWPALADEDEQGVTIAYEDLLEEWGKPEMNADRPTLRQFLLREPHDHTTGISHIVAVMEDIAQATRRISSLLNQGALGGALGSAGSENVQGESQKKLDVISNEIMLECLEWSAHWAGLASEQVDHAVAVSGPEAPGGRYLCLFDPLDGSSNIDTNGAVGTIFSILRCPQGVKKLDDAHFLQPGTEQVAAGFALYGPSTLLILTTGNGVHGFTLDRGSDEYLLTNPDMRVQEEAQDFTINMSNQRYWTKPIQRYIDELVEEGETHRGLHFNMRWMGSMAADVYRLLISGGIFLYPWDSRVPGRPESCACSTRSIRSAS